MPSRPYYGNLQRQRILPAGLVSSLSEAQRVRTMKDELKAKKPIVVVIPAPVQPSPIPSMTPASEVKNES
ncbi:hypothetical protein [Nostoc sp. 'Peltigera membranacea cyanobiont' 232]|uniref:hypothetical protein n=1 Tax=Nostoc sp. 'Peltigera membranacea cyanobiont' 232 TaxID=2014531 RepID=UPI000B95760C|nr:hypothetical protein [Nostoc sp. 'Peltigera membranacea cyanobiont' 232]OYE02139.1 hypothetical protein CDG79_25560 [Nostoc sp. 'Peltigera membranacea cyanobiont' 232]